MPTCPWRQTTALKVTGITLKSLREIGRELAEEIERVFEAKVNPRTLISKTIRANRQNDSNGSHDGNKATTPLHPGDSGDKLTPNNVVKLVEKVVKHGLSIREVAAVIRLLADLP